MSTNMKSTWSLILAFRGSGTKLASASSGQPPSSCSAPQGSSCRAASARPVDGAGEEHAESAGWGDSLFLPLVLSLSSSSSLDKMTIKKMLNTSGVSFLSVKYVNTLPRWKVDQICFGSPPDMRLIKMNEDKISSL